jgi:hypothetical protein
MKLLLPLILLALLPMLAAGADEELVEAFRVTAPKELERPLVGALYRSYWLSKVKETAKVPEAMELEMIRPGDADDSAISIKVPYLCRKGNEQVAGQRIALRERLPRERDVAALTNYDDVVKLLGAPTILPIGGETEDEWAYDAVTWRLFTPVTKWCVRVLDVSVHRKTRKANRNEVLMEVMSVGGGMFTEKGRRFLLRDSEGSRRAHAIYEKAIVDLPRIEAPNVEAALLRIIEVAREQKQAVPGMVLRFDPEEKRPMVLQAGRKSMASVLEELAAAGDFYLYARDHGLRASRECDARAETPEVKDSKDPFAVPK